ncbi:hypothetical protein GCM10027291_03290 [Telluribacter humicola]
MTKFLEVQGYERIINLDKIIEFRKGERGVHTPTIIFRFDSGEVTTFEFKDVKVRDSVIESIMNNEEHLRLKSDGRPNEITDSLVHNSL